MVEVDCLHEGLHARAASNLLLRHAASNAQGVLVNTSNHCETVLALALTLLRGSNNNCLAAGVSALQNNDDLTGLQATEKSIRNFDLLVREHKVATDGSTIGMVSFTANKIRLKINISMASTYNFMAAVP